ncbi:MAG: histidine kinase, partial [Eubacteriales bacterium]|nr:histidine kinase [Eubacteriales bacterium]
MKTGFRDIRLQNKFILIFVLVMFIPTIVLGFILFSQYQTTLRQQSFEYKQNALTEIYQYVDDAIGQDIAQFEEVFYSREFIDSILEAEYSEGTNVPFFVESGTVVSMLADMLEETHGFSSAYVYLNSGRRYVFQKNDEKCDPLYNLDEELWIKQIEEDKSDKSFIGLHIDMQTINKNNSVFSIVLRMDLTEKPDISYPDAHVSEFDGIFFTTPVYMICNMDFDYFVNTFLNGEYSGEITCTDRDGTIFFSSNESLIGEKIETYIDDVDTSQQEGNVVSDIEEEKYLVSWRRSEFTGITTFIVEENDELVKELNDMKALTILSISAFSVIFIVLVIFVIRSITKPVEKLVKAMTTENGQRKGVPVKVDRKDEIGVLGAQYNAMLNDIDQLLTEIKGGYERERRLENEVLEAQINPHFIYNTLNSIRNIAIMQNSQTVATSIKELIL